RKHAFNVWWSFIVYGLAVSVVPASLTNERFHMLRLAPLPVFLIALAIPGATWLIEKIDRSRRLIPGAVLLLMLGQGFFFTYRYHAYGYTARRLHLFDADYPSRLLPAALATNQNPIYICDASAVPGYIQALWYATLQNIPRERFVVLPPADSPPQNSVVI